MQLVSKSFRSFPSYMSAQRLVCGGSISRPGPTWDDAFAPFVSCRLRNPFPTLGDDTSEQRLEPKRAAGKINQTLTILTTCLAQSKGSCVASTQMPLKHGSRKDFLFSVAGQTDTWHTKVITKHHLQSCKEHSAENLRRLSVGGKKSEINMSSVFFWMHFHREGSGRLPSSPSRSAKPLRRHLWGNYSPRSRLPYIPRSLRVAFAKSWCSV